MLLPLSDDNKAIDPPVVNSLIIWSTVVAFIFEVMYVLQHGRDSLHPFLLVSARFIHHFDLMQLATLLTIVLLHGGFLHLIGNVWYLAIFGDNVEDKLGHWRYLALYLICGISASLVHVIFNPTDTIGCVGASGCVAGVMGAYMMLFPEAKVKTWIFLFWIRSIPAWATIGGWFLYNCIAVVTHNSAPIGWFAHIGGFYAGVLLVYLLKPKDCATMPCDTLIARSTSSAGGGLGVTSKLACVTLCLLLICSISSSPWARSYNGYGHAQTREGQHTAQSASTTQKPSKGSSIGNIASGHHRDLSKTSSQSTSKRAHQVHTHH